MKLEKNSFSILVNSNPKFFFYKLKAQSSLHICVKFYFSRVCKTHKSFQLFIKLLLKISFFEFFFVFCGLLKTRDIFLQSRKFLLNYHQQNFINAFFKKLTGKIYLNKKLLKNEILKNHSNCFVSKT